VGAFRTRPHDTKKKKEEVSCIKSLSQKGVKGTTWKQKAVLGPGPLFVKAVFLRVRAEKGTN